jgi:hypothetical protein
LQRERWTRQCCTAVSLRAEALKVAFDFVRRGRTMSSEEAVMKRIALIAVLCAMAGSAYAQTPTSCTASAMEKKLAGAAKTSFMKKCEADAMKACDASAAEKKLAGAAKTSFTKKCLTDAKGS